MWEGVHRAWGVDSGSRDVSIHRLDSRVDQGPLDEPSLASTPGFDVRCIVESQPGGNFLHPPILHWSESQCKPTPATWKENVTHEIICTQIERLPEVGAGDDCIIDRGRVEVVAIGIFVGTDERAAILASVDRRGTS